MYPNSNSFNVSSQPLDKEEEFKPALKSKSIDINKEPVNAETPKVTKASNANIVGVNIALKPKEYTKPEPVESLPEIQNVNPEIGKVESKTKKDQNMNNSETKELDGSMVGVNPTITQDISTPVTEEDLTKTIISDSESVSINENDQILIEK